MSLRLDYDLDANALYITLSSAIVSRTIEIDSETMVDLDSAGNLVGIEVIDHQRSWPLGEILSKYELEASAVAQLRALFRQSASHVERQVPAAIPA